MAFDAKSTTDDVLAGVDLSGKRMLVTGASAGLGVETVRALTAHGAEVVGTARDAGKARAALSSAGAGDVTLIEADLASLASVRTATDELLKLQKPFDVLIANAGVMACPEGRTADGFETQFGTNHLGHFVFVNRLVPLLRAPARIVVLSSAGHRMGDVDLDDPNFEHTPYNPWVAYGRSKTANALFAAGLDKRLRERGVRAVAVHPGGIQTELTRHLTPDLREQMAQALKSRTLTAKTIPQGAATTVWCAAIASPDAIGGRYCENCQVANFNEDNELRSGGVQPYALDPSRADALWVKSEAMVGEKFSFA